VLPVLPVVGFMLITGRGLHSSRAVGQQEQGEQEQGQVHSTLKEKVGEYLQQRGLVVEAVPGNDGAICVLCIANISDAQA